jgi:hypothetical protein
VNEPIAVALPFLLLVAFSDYLWEKYRTWRYFIVHATRRPEEPPRSFRNFMVALGLWLGIFALFVRSVAFYALPQFGESARFLGFVAYGGLIVIAVFLLATRRQRELTGLA